MSERVFFRATIAGLIATFVMTMTGFWVDGIGLPQMDVGATLAESSDHGWTWGNLAHFINGVLLALIYVQWVRPNLPGNWIVKGIAYGILATLASAIVVAPLAAGAGIFFSKTPIPVAMTTASTIVHLAYGLALALSYEVAVRGAEVRGPLGAADD
jgi:uncharacterized membrane protein YagU involved in acid resistance